MTELSTVEFIKGKVFKDSLPNFVKPSSKEQEDRLAEYNEYMFYRLCTINYMNGMYQRDALTEEQWQLLLEKASTREGVKAIGIMVMGAAMHYAIDFSQLEAIEVEEPTH